MLRQFVRDETGATAIEYALIASLLAVGVAGSVGVLGGSYESMYGKIVDTLAANTP